jgi:hypothetical protein
MSFDDLDIATAFQAKFSELLLSSHWPPESIEVRIRCPSAAATIFVPSALIAKPCQSRSGAEVLVHENWVANADDKKFVPKTAGKKENKGAMRRVITSWLTNLRRLFIRRSFC